MKTTVFPFAELRRSNNVAVFIWYTDALSKRPVRTTYAHTLNTKRNELVSTIGVPFRHQGETGRSCHPKIVGWEYA